MVDGVSRTEKLFPKSIKSSPNKLQEEIRKGYESYELLWFAQHLSFICGETKFNIHYTPATITPAERNHRGEERATERA